MQQMSEKENQHIRVNLNGDDHANKLHLLLTRSVYTLKQLKGKMRGGNCKMMHVTMTQPQMLHAPVKPQMSHGIMSHFMVTKGHHFC